MSLNYSTKPNGIIDALLNHRQLIWELVKREFAGRYKGSIIGMAWSLLNPLMMLAVYTMVFSVVFNARWGSGEESKTSFAIVLFAGMIVHGFFAECLNRAPGLVVSQPNYVKKVVFPLEVLPWATMISALLHFLVSLSLLLVFCLLTQTPIHATVALIPVVMLPLLLMTLGLTWLFASLGVFLRDIAQAMGAITTVMLFLSPVFYKSSALPENYQRLIALNPLTQPIEQLRDVMLWGRGIEWFSWGINMVLGIAICQMGFWWFQKTRKGFADVI